MDSIGQPSVQEGDIRDTGRVQEGYRKGTVGVQEGDIRGYRRCTGRVQ